MMISKRLTYSSISVLTILHFAWSFTSISALYKTSNWLIYQHSLLKQHHIKPILSKYSQLRNYYAIPGSKPPITAPHVILAGMIANKTNRSLLAIKTVSQSLKTSIMLSSPAIIPEIQATAKFEIRKAIKSRKMLPYFVYVKPGFHTINYCAAPQRRLENVWNFRSLQSEQFEEKVWVCIIISGISVSFVLGIRNFRKRSFKFEGLVSISALLTSGMVNLPKDLRHSGLLCVWMFCSTILQYLYSGSVTSVVIMPSEEVTMESVDDIWSNNYTILFENQISYEYWYSALDRVSPKFQLMHPYVKTMRKLIKYKSKVWNPSLNADFLDELIYRGKHASLSTWTSSLRNVQVFSSLIEKNKKFKGDRKCHVVNEIIHSGHIYFGFVSPKSSRLQNIFLNMIQAGLYSYWEREANAMVYSQRVQDRVKVLGPAKLVKDFDENENGVEPLRLRRKVVRIFTLWLNGLAAGTIVALIEQCGRILKCVIKCLKRCKCIIGFLWTQLIKSISTLVNQWKFYFTHKSFCKRSIKALGIFICYSVCKQKISHGIGNGIK